MRIDIVRDLECQCIRDVDKSVSIMHKKKRLKG